MKQRITTMAVLGTGAVGSYFVWGLQDKLKENVWVIADGERKRRLEREGISVNGEDLKLQVKTPQEAKGVDLLIVATKYDGLKACLDDIADIVTEDTIVISPLNGVDSEEIIASRIGMEHLLFSVMHIASQRVGRFIEFNPDITMGITFGEAKQSEPSERMLAVAKLFEGSGVRYHFGTDIMRDVWHKFAFNVSRNLPQAMLNCVAGVYTDSEHGRHLMLKMREEVCALAAAKGIDISDLAPVEQLRYPSSPKARYSTLQDLDAGRHTEIEMFAGTVLRLGKELGIATPYNDFAYHAIKLLEERNDGKFTYETVTM